MPPKNDLLWFSDTNFYVFGYYCINVLGKLSKSHTLLLGSEDIQDVRFSM